MSSPTCSRFWRIDRKSRKASPAFSNRCSPTARSPGFYKELIAVRVSQQHNSTYAVRAHSISARQKGATEPQIEGIANFETGPYTEKEKIGFRLADRLHQGASAVDDEFFATLAASFSEVERIELFLTAAAFAMFPRFIDGLRIPVAPPPAAK